MSGSVVVAGDRDRAVLFQRRISRVFFDSAGAHAAHVCRPVVLSGVRRGY